MLSSLTTVLTSALVCSTRPPESVCGTVTSLARLEDFLGSMGSMTSRDLTESLDIASRRSETVDLPAVSAYRFVPGHPTPGWPTLLRHPITQTLHWWCRNINLLSIAYAFRPRLRYRLTLGRLPLPRKPWTHGERVSHPLYRYSCLHNRFQDLDASLRSHFTGNWNAPLPNGRLLGLSRGFGVMLEPRYIFGAGSLDQ